MCDKSIASKAIQVWIKVIIIIIIIIIIKYAAY